MAGNPDLFLGSMTQQTNFFIKSYFLYTVANW